MSSIALTLARRWSGMGHSPAQMGRLFATFRLALQVRRERRALLALDEGALKDVGFTRGDADAEARRSFWDVPVDRLRL